VTEPVVVPPLVAEVVRTALAERDRRQGLPGMTRTAALVASELAVAPVTTPDTVRTVAAWHQAHPEATLDDGRSTLLGGVWGGRAGRDWALAMAARLAAPAFIDPLEGRRTEGPVAAGVAVVAADTGRVLMLQRALDPTGEDEHGGKWEFPGGKLDEGEGAYEAAQREFGEEARIPVPGKLAGDWTSPDGVYHGFIHVVPAEGDVTLNVDHEDRHVSNPDDPDGDNVEVVAWWSIDDADGNQVVRREVLDGTPWDDLRDVARARRAAAVVAALQASGEWHNSDGFSPEATGEQLAAHLAADHGLGDTVPALDRDDLDQLHYVEHSRNGEVGAHTNPRTAAISDPLPILGRPNGGDVDRKRLERASRRLAKVDRDLRTRLQAGADVAMADGLRRAGVKVTQRAQKRSKAVQASVTGCDGVYPEAVLAAAGITEQEALGHAFDAFAEKANHWIEQAQAQKARILAAELSADAPTLERAKRKWSLARSVAVGVIVGGLYALAVQRLTKGHPHDPEPEGETPVSPLVPGGLIGDAIAAADGKPVSGDPASGTAQVDKWAPGVTFEVIDETGVRVGVITDGRPVVERIVWRWNDSEHPFDPHLDLDGTAATADTIGTVWAKSPDVFPYNTTYFFPGDHHGCNCAWDSSFETGGAPLAGEGVAASAGTLEGDNETPPHLREQAGGTTGRTGPDGSEAYASDRQDPAANVEA
jgi:8-oxo-dGTP pyrophosphatase MutT (NUDIX family)